jgi:lysophospholipase L1-like esterase
MTNETSATQWQDRLLSDIGTTRFEDDVLASIRQIHARPPSDKTIALYGSSSFRFWQSMASDLRCLDVVNLGFGGGTFASGIHYFDSLLTPLAPRKVVLYFGENDISNDGLTAQSTFANFRSLVALIDKRLGARIFVLSAKQSPTKWMWSDEVAEFNARAKAFCQQQSHMRFIDVGSVLMGENGRPMARYFMPDLIHLNAAGYALWADFLRKAEGLFDEERT